MSYDDGATVGAIAGTNLKDSSNNSLGDEDVRNSDLSLAYSGTNIQIKKGSTQIGSNLDAPSTLKNAQITTKADGTLNYDGTGAVAPNINNIPDAGNTKTYAGYAGLGLAANGDVNRTVPTAKGGTGTTNTADFLNSDIITANVDPAYIKFNKDQSNYAPRRNTRLDYKYADNSSNVYTAGVTSLFKSWLSSIVTFYEGATLIATLEFIHIVDYGENQASAGYAGDEIRTYWNSITAENSSGVAKTDFTVKFLVPSGTNNAIETTEIFCSEEDAGSPNNTPATNGLASSPLEYGGDYVTYEVEVTHDSSGVVSLHRVYLETIGNTAPVK